MVNIKKWDKCYRKISSIHLRKKGNVMAGVISLKNYAVKKEKSIRAYSLLDLILDPQKKSEFDNFYDKNYEYIEKDDFSKKIFKKDK